MPALSASCSLPRRRVLTRTLSACGLWAMLGPLSTLGAQALPAGGAGVPAPGATPVPQRTPWNLQLSGYTSSADQGFGIWRGGDLRLLYSGSQFSPFASIGMQRRPEGVQQVIGVGSYVVLTKWLYSIVGYGAAADRGTVLFPKARADLSLHVAVPRVPGMLLSAGITDLRFTDPRSGGQILSVGSMYYRGRGIYTGTVRLNTDRASGAKSSSWQAGAQWGAQGKSWFGVGAGAGNEAYQVLSATPFDARFRSWSASVFWTTWVTTHTGIGLRYDFERKIDVYRRHALGLSTFVEF